MALLVLALTSLAAGGVTGYRARTTTVLRTGFLVIVAIPVLAMVAAILPIPFLGAFVVTASAVAGVPFVAGLALGRVARGGGARPRRA